MGQFAAWVAVLGRTSKRERERSSQPKTGGREARKAARHSYESEQMGVTSWFIPRSCPIRHEPSQL
eukprot:scaffold510_cov141-Skeletonema_marinoi.AAC.12